MPRPKILVACITSDLYEYCLGYFLCALKHLTYPNFDLLIVDNSQTESYREKLEKALAQEKIKCLGVMRIEYSEQARERMVRGRNLLRKYFLEHEEYDYFFCLEQDVMVPKDILEKLLSHKKEVVSGVFFGLAKSGEDLIFKPILYKTLTEEEFNAILHHPSFDNSELKKQIMAAGVTSHEEVIRQFAYQEVLKPQLLEARRAGLGCVLISREVLRKIAFRYDKGKGVFDDTWFFDDVKKEGYKFFVDTGVKCEHHFVTRPWHWSQLVEQKKF